MSEEPKVEERIPEQLTLSDFQKRLIEIDSKGREATLKHKESFPEPVKDKDGKQVEIKGGKRYHAPGTDTKCPFCTPIFDNFNAFQQLQIDHFSVRGIPMDGLLSAMRITIGVLRMLERENKEALDVNMESKSN